MDGYVFIGVSSAGTVAGVCVGLLGTQSRDTHRRRGRRRLGDLRPNGEEAAHSGPWLVHQAFAARSRGDR